MAYRLMLSKYVQRGEYHKHLKKSNAAGFYTPIVLKLLTIVQMWKQHEEGNNNNFDTTFVKIDQVLIILWRLKGEKYSFQLLQ